MKGRGAYSDLLLWTLACYQDLMTTVQPDTKDEAARARWVEKASAQLDALHKKYCP